MVAKMSTELNELLQVYPIIKASRELFSLDSGLMRKDTCEGGLRKPAKYEELEQPSRLELQPSASYNLVLEFLLVHF